MENLNASLSAQKLIRAGLQNLSQARDILEQLHDEGLSSECMSRVLVSLGAACDPDIALRNLRDIVHAYHQRGETLREALPHDDQLSRLLAVLGASKTMGFLMMSRPQLVEAAGKDPHSTLDYDAAQREAAMLAAAGFPEEQEYAPVAEHRVAASSPRIEDAVNAMRREYYLQLAAIMAFDVLSPNPVDVQPKVSTMLSALADAALRTALTIAKHHVEHGDICRFAIIAMGKLGSQELNYVSDVDLIYVVEPADEHVDNQLLIRVGTKIAMMVQKICQSVMAGVTEPPLWQIDGGLRPEGKDGPLVRRLQSHISYYEQWAESWEFQALLKARPVAGDEALGAAYYDSTRRFVWNASQRSNFVYDCQRMRRRVESLIPDALKDREIKLGRGGLRDVEFTVQMLQLVHGRTDVTLRTASTLQSLRALAQGGYVSRKQASQLSVDYAFERVIEHRQQMWELKRTHLFPNLGKGSIGGIERVREITREELDANGDLRRLARALHLYGDELVNRFDATRREIRKLHQDIYYRPMLPISAQTQTDDIRLSTSAARDRFASIGFQDPQSAMRHVESLTTGLSRATKINRILLPAVLEWLGQGQNPDMGLLGWRTLAERFGKGSQYLGFLRDSPSAAQRLCHILSNSRLMSDALYKSSESITWLGNDEQLKLRSTASLHTQTQSAIERFAERPAEFANSIRAMRRHEIERIGLGWMSHVLQDNECLQGMTDVYDAMLAAALTWAINHRTQVSGSVTHPSAVQPRAVQPSTVQPSAKIAIIAMGRYGGSEVNFSSDADIIAIYEPNDGSDAREANLFAVHVLDDMRQVLSGSVSLEDKLDLDMDLRPEGKNGPLIRSLESCREYYHSWASTWEHQALLRARFAAGDEGLAQRFMHEIADPLRYPQQPLNHEQIGEIRKLKARMESERLPRGVRRERHIKLGKGGLSDIEWTVQLLQLQHAGDIAALRTSSTLPALQTLREAGLISQEDTDVLRESWMMCTAARNGNYLWSGRASRADILPDDVYSLGGIAMYVGYAAHQGQRFENDILATMRRCREITNRVFYGI